jgi:hypothetical protein
MLMAFSSMPENEITGNQGRIFCAAVLFVRRCVVKMRQRFFSPKFHFSTCVDMKLLVKKQATKNFIGCLFAKKS